jgi:outer membrane lipoprotein carrier protein
MQTVDRNRGRPTGRPSSFCPFAILCVLCVCRASPTASAQTPTAASLAKLVDAHYNHLHSLQTRYTERYQGLGLDRSETGTLTLQKPGRMRWAYDTPAGKLFLLDGHSAISYTPGDAQATRLSEKQLDDLRSPLRFLLGHTELGKELSNLTVAPAGAGLYALSGTPTAMQQRLKTLSLTVDATGQIRAMRIEEIDGSTTTFLFSGMRENVATSAADFSFTPPPGVTVVNGAAPI